MATISPARQAKIDKYEKQLADYQKKMEEAVANGKPKSGIQKRIDSLEAKLTALKGSTSKPIQYLGKWYQPGDEGYDAAKKAITEIVSDSKSITGSTTISDSSSTSFSEDEQQYVDADGDGETDLLILGGDNSSSDSSSSSVSGTYTVNGITYDVATGRPISGVTGGSTTKIFSETSEIPKFPKNPPPPHELTSQQLKAYRTLIRDNPQDEKWQEKIKDLKDRYPRLANEQNFTQQQLDNLSEEEYEAYTNRLEKYGKVNFPNVTAVSPSTAKEVLAADHCKGNFIDEVEVQLNNFIDLVSRAQQFNLDLPGEIKGISKLIGKASQSFVSGIANNLADGMISWVKDGMDKIAGDIFAAFPKFQKALPKVIGAQSALIPFVTKMFGSVDCLVNKVTNALTGAVEDMLTGMVKNVLNGPACAINQFVGAITGKIGSLVDNFISPVTGPLNKVLGAAFKVKDFVSKGANLLNKLQDPFGCKPKKPKCVNPKYKIDGNGVKTKSDAEQQNVLDKVFDAGNDAMDQVEKKKDGLLGGVKEGISDFEKEYGQWSIFGSKVGEAEDHGLGTNCYTGNVFKCGAPKVTLFGGNGIGGAGKILLGKFVDNLDVNDIYGDIERTASIVGVEITDPGEGYTDEPLVSFSDSCDKGYGAYGQAVVDKNVNSPTYGQITNIVILSEGINYPVDTPAETKPVYIKEIIVENPGKGYEDAEIEDECLTLNVVDGRIKSIDVTCQKEYSSIPTIKIKNAGFGAVLRPIMTTERRIIEQDLVQSIDCVGKPLQPERGS